MRAKGRGAAERPPLALVAEDATIIRLDICQLLLERAGFGEVIEARDGEEAVALARERQPDLAILDVNMPKLDGIEAARKILAEQSLPIVMLTAYADEGSVSRAVEAGAFAYVVKPFREQDLLPAIRAAQARHEELLELREEFDSVTDELGRSALRSRGERAADAQRRALGRRRIRETPERKQTVRATDRGDRGRRRCSVPAGLGAAAARRENGRIRAAAAKHRGMADESLIEEMRATLRGDRERAEQRRSSEPALAGAVQVGLLPERSLPLEEAPQLEVKTEPEVARGLLRWLRRR